MSKTNLYIKGSFKASDKHGSATGVLVYADDTKTIINLSDLADSTNAILIKCLQRALSKIHNDDTLVVHVNTTLGWNNRKSKNVKLINEVKAQAIKRNIKIELIEKDDTSCVDYWARDYSLN